MKHPWAQRLYELRVQNNLSQQVVAGIYCIAARRPMAYMSWTAVSSHWINLSCWLIIITSLDYLTGRTDRSGLNRNRKGTPMKNNKLTIGQMAKLNKTTVPTLRLYERLGPLSLPISIRIMDTGGLAILPSLWFSPSHSVQHQPHSKPERAADSDRTP